jgi:myo-inositol-1(or 4)-monophosphatase
MAHWQEYLDFAVETVHIAGHFALGYYQTHLSPDIKEDGSLVTEADRRIETFIHQRVMERFPDHGFLGEEFGDSGGSSSMRWIVDPIDGTRAFTCGVPFFSVLMALEVNHIPVAGVAYFPALEKTLYGAKGMGSFLNGRRIYVNDRAACLSEGVVTFTNESNFTRNGLEDVWNRIKAAAGYLGGWGDAYGYLLLATGNTILHMEPMVQVWDCAPFLPIIQEAGGYMGDWEGHETVFSRQSMAMPRQILPEVLALTSPQTAQKARQE